MSLAVTGPESVVLAGRGGWLVALDAVRAGAAHAGAAVGVQAAEQLLVLAHQAPGVLGVRGRDDVTVLVLGDREQPVEVLQILDTRADQGRQVLIEVQPELPGTHDRAHDGKLAQHGAHRVGLTRGEQVGQVLDRDPQRVDGGEHTWSGSPES